MWILPLTFQTISIGMHLRLVPLERVANGQKRAKRRKNPILSNLDSNNIPFHGELIPGDDGDAENYKDFERELEETVQRLFEGVDQDNVILEISSLRTSYNMSLSYCTGALFSSVMKLALKASQSPDCELCNNTENTIVTLKVLLKNYLKGNDAQIEALQKFEEMCMATAKDFAPFFSKIMYRLYEEDILSEDAILMWAMEKEGADESDRLFLDQSEQFITWLREAPEEDDD